MKQLMRNLAIFGIVMFVVLPASWSGEFDYASYTRTTFQAIIAEEENHHSSDTGYSVNSTSRAEGELLVFLLRRLSER